MGTAVRLGAPEVPTPEPQRGAAAGGRALVLGGGGITGAAFEVGALLALDALLDPPGVAGFDLFVGTSAGALLAACLAAGVTPAELAASQVGRPAPGLPLLTERAILSPAPGGGRAWGSALAGMVRRFARVRAVPSLLDAAFGVADGLGSWHPYTTDGIGAWVREMLAARGCADGFEGLGGRLLVAATDLDTGDRVLFGEEGAPDVPVSRAVAASAAIPLVYEPVSIEGREYADGGLVSATNLDAALRRCVSLAVVVNPLVPFRHEPGLPIRRLEGPIRRVSHAGPWRLVAQAFRTIARAQLDRELAAAVGRAPGAGVLVLEPRAEDETLFVYSLMDFGAREEVLGSAFRQVAVDLVLRFDEVQALLEGAGLHAGKDALVEAAAAQVRTAPGWGRSWEEVS